MSLAESHEHFALDVAANALKCPHVCTCQRKRTVPWCLLPNMTQFLKPSLRFRLTPHPIHFGRGLTPGMSRHTTHLRVSEECLFRSEEA